MWAIVDEWGGIVWWQIRTRYLSKECEFTLPLIFKTRREAREFKKSEYHREYRVVKLSVYQELYLSHPYAKYSLSKD